MRTLLLRAAPIAAFALLAACQPTTVTGGGDNDPTASEIAAAPPIKLPPAMLASKTYRCKDNSIIYVDFFNDNMTGNLRTVKNGAPTALTAPEAGKPYEGGGYTVTGTATGKSITLTGPKGTQSCNV
jgi:hypothetical protein